MRICQRLLLLGLVGLLTACDQQAMFEKLVPEDEVATAKRLLSQLAAKEYAAVEKELDPSLQASSLRNTLEQMAAVFPPEQPKGINTVGSNITVVNGVTTYDLTFEHEYSSAWMLTNVVLQHRNGRTTVLGLHVNPMKSSLKEINRFTFEGKSPLHYIFFAVVVAVPIFVIFALVLCIKTPIAKRKWLWLLFVALGFVQFSLNWTDGSYGVQPISFVLLGAAFFRAGPYAPFVFHVAIPMGAIVFLAKRRSLSTEGEL